MRTNKVHTEASIKKNFTGRAISKRTANIRLKVVRPGDTPESKAQRSAILSGWIKDKQAVNSRKRQEASKVKAAKKAV